MKNDEIMNNIINIFYTHKERYGYRRIALELRNKGYIVNHKKVKRLMSVMELYGKTPKAKYKSYKAFLLLYETPIHLLTIFHCNLLC